MQFWREQLKIVEMESRCAAGGIAARGQSPSAGSRHREVAADRQPADLLAIRGRRQVGQMLGLYFVRLRQVVVI